MHNTLPEYRIQWFNEIKRESKCDFLITNEKLNKKVYGIDIEYEKIKKLDCIFLSKGIKGYTELYSVVKKINNYDFVLLPPIDSFREFIMANIVLKICKNKKILTGYFWEKWEAPKELQPIIRKIKNFLLLNAAKTIFINTDIVFAGGTKSRTYFIENGTAKNKIIILPDVSEVPDCEYVNIREKYNISNDKKIIMYFGRIIEQKGLDILIKAYSKLKNKNSYFLLIVGEGEFRQSCEELANKLKIKNICFAGRVNPAERKNYFEQCDLFVFPGTYRKGLVDVWGLTVNEALQCGKIIVATEGVGSAIDLIKNKVNGYVIKPQDEELLARTIEKAMNEISIEKMTTYNRKKLEYYNYHNMGKIFLNEIERLKQR